MVSDNHASLDAVDRAREIVLETLRCFLGTGEPGALRRLVESGPVDWSELAYQSIHHKCVGLVWMPFKQQRIPGLLPKELRRNFATYYAATQLRNRVYCDELIAILEAFDTAGVTVFPLKGSVLIPEVFKDPGLRTVGDIDLLASAHDYPRIKAIMTELGFSQAGIDAMSMERHSLLPGQEDLRQRSMNQLVPFHKVTDHPFNPSIDVDVSISPSPHPGRIVFGDRKRLESRSRPFQLSSRSFRRLGNEEFLIQLCLHLYKEATRAEWLALQADLNLIKFVDVYAFSILSEIDGDVLVEICCAEQVTNEVAAALHWTMLALGGDFAAEWLTALRPGIVLEDRTSFMTRVWDVHSYQGATARKAVADVEAAKVKDWAQRQAQVELAASRPCQPASMPGWDKELTGLWEVATAGGVRDGNFFDQGGDSIKAVNLIASIKQRLSVDVPFHLLVAAEGLEGLRRFVEESVASRDSA